MLPAKSRVFYTRRLGQQLQAAGVDLAWLYPRINGNTQALISAKLSHPAFSHPEELARSGYPQAQIEQAERIAELILTESASAITALYDETKRNWVEPEPVREESDESGVEETTVETLPRLPGDEQEQPSSDKVA